MFLDQLLGTLTAEQRADTDSDINVGAMAMLHGRDLHEQGFTLEQVIRDYGDVCQAVTILAVETGAPILAAEFRILNRCLDDAIAGAVTAYSERNDAALNESQEALAHTEAALSAAQMEAHNAYVRALHDSLTGLPNRELFDDRLDHAICLAKRHNWTLAVMFLDLDQFKNINDAHGHAVGDLVLKVIAERLQQQARNADTVCRNGGDEFLYLLMHPQGKENIERIADSILKGIAQPVDVDGLQFAVKPSIGAAVYPGDGTSGEQLIKNADTAMYRAKKHARGFVFFSPRISREATGHTPS